MEKIICKNCDKVYEDKFCNHCGQKNYTEKDKSFKHIFDEVLHFLTYFEGSFITTLKSVLTRPGQLSKDYCNGKRKTYYKPISFFLLIVVLYLLFPLANGMNQKLETHAYNIIAGGLIGQQIKSKMTTEDIGEEVLSEKFHNISGETSKILMLLLIPLTALFVAILFFRQKKYAFDYVILATELNSFMMLSLFLLLPLLIVPAFLFFRIPDNNLDDIMAPFLGIIVLIYTIVLFAASLPKNGFLQYLNRLFSVLSI